ncbi:MAG: MATE family efflux transporter [Desulfobacteraceae bacterium 4572_19]|nr:MAG: MATE family efflux transporter [Desulfobacteraceae bacterium 4572_19]
MKTYSQEIKSTISLAVPLVIGQLGHMSMSVVDNLMVGNLGAVPLAAASVANSFFMLITIVGLGISMAITPLTAMYYGSQKFSECGVVLRQGLLVNMTVGIILCVVSILSAKLIGYFNQPKEIVQPAIIYMQTLGLSMLPIMLFQTYRQFAEGISIMRPAMIITIVANIVNIIVNWMFIYGNFGAPALGLTGAGVATFLSRMFMAVAMVYIVVCSTKMKKYDPTFRFKSFNLPMMKKLLRIGIPTGVQYFFEVSAFAGSVVIVGWFGTNALAAHQIALNLASVTYMVALGISSAATVRVANAAGNNNNIFGTRQAGFSAVILVAFVMGCFSVLFIALRHFLPTLYISEKEIINLAASLLVIVALFQVSDGVQTICLGALRGIADVKIPTLITFLAYWVIGLPVGYILGFKYQLGVTGIWIGLLIGLTASATMVMLRFNKRSKKAVHIIDS